MNLLIENKIACQATKSPRKNFVSLRLFGKILLTVFLFSCGEKTSETPDNLIPRETFVNVLVDFALAESAANTNIKNVPFNKTDSLYNFNPLEENKVTKAQYDTTLAFYSSHTELYKEVYQEVLQKLNAMQTQRDSLKNKN